ncbi:MAG: GNAT family N-acetyltransferase [Anaerolineales bacterium]
MLAGIIQSMFTPITIRLAKEEDVDSLANLAAQLGYPAESGQVLQRLRDLLARRDEHTVYVAERDGQVLGWVHAHIYRLLIDVPEVEIGGLVVDESARGGGIGEKLMQAAEAWAMEKGCASVYLRSNTIRTRAHEFYKRIGYEIVKSQYAFRKKL